MLSYSDFLQRKKNNEISCESFTRLLLDKIEEENKKLNCFITVASETAMEQAAESDRRFASGQERPLEGMIVAVKDNISTIGLGTTCSSKMLENFKPVYDATVVTRLKEAGAIIIGKTNMDEFAMGSSNETSYFGTVQHPLEHDHIPGGSSGGSAAAAAAGLCHVSLGSDTGGSVRQPASFCGLFGLKPSYGRISRYGLVAFASSLDQIGIFSAHIDDTARVMDVISGTDRNDSTCASYDSTASYGMLEKEALSLKIGVLPFSDIEMCDKEIVDFYKRSLEIFKEAGHEVKEVTLSYPKAWLPTYYIISTAEASSNLSRFDGVRYGFRAELKAGDNIYSKTRSLGFGAEVKRRIMTGTYVLSSGHYDAYYTKAQKVRRIIYDNYNAAFEDVDVIFMPSTPTPAFRKGEKGNNPVTMYLSDFYTASANLGGVAAINIPVAESSAGFPFGMQLQSKIFEDEKLLNISNRLHRLLQQK